MMDEYVKLAVKSVESYVRTGQVIATEEAAPEIRERQAAAFVSIHKGEALRGCIGTIAPMYENLAEEIIRNGIAAATRDPRFSAITPEELPELTINVDVLSEPEQIDDIALLDVKKYGVIVVNGMRRGVLLPDLEGVDTPEQQIHIAMQKAGIAFDETIDLYRFEVVRHV